MADNPVTLSRRLLLNDQAFIKPQLRRVLKEAGVAPYPHDTLFDVDPANAELDDVTLEDVDVAVDREVVDVFELYDPRYNDTICEQFRAVLNIKKSSTYILILLSPPN